MEKKIKVNEKEFTIRELLATELDEALEQTDRKEIVRIQVCKSTGISNEDYSKLTVKERLSILTVINELNGILDFQKSSN